MRAHFYVPDSNSYSQRSSVGDLKKAEDFTFAYKYRFFASSTLVLTCSERTRHKLGKDNN